MRAKAEKGAQPSKNEFSLEIHKRGGAGAVTLIGGHITWGRGKEWRQKMSCEVLGLSKKGSGKLGKA
jgi:hypothetical protein